MELDPIVTKCESNVVHSQITCFHPTSVRLGDEMLRSVKSFVVVKQRNARDKKFVGGGGTDATPSRNCISSSKNALMHS